jgi:hypothetical protein
MDETDRDKGENIIKPSVLHETQNQISRFLDMDWSVFIENTAIRLGVVENLCENLLRSEIVQVIPSIFCKNRST